jgi:hypothetical protein
VITEGRGAAGDGWLGWVGLEAQLKNALDLFFHFYI